MPAYTLPSFNLLADIWLEGVTEMPANGPADLTGIPVQKYINPRAVWDVSPPWFTGFYLQYTPPIMFRFARAAPFLGSPKTWAAVCLEVPQGSSSYYRVYWQELMHEGFPNEYVLLVGTPCDADLKAVPPPGGSLPTGVGADPGGVTPPAVTPPIVLPPGPFPPVPVGAGPFLDNFNDSPGVSITAHIADTGQHWTQGIGLVLIDGGGTGAIATGSIGQNWPIGLATGPTDGTVSLDFDTPASWITAIYQGVLIRALDSFNWIGWLVEWNGASWQLTCYKSIAGVVSPVGSPSATFVLSPSSSYNLSVILLGSTMNATITGPGAGVSNSLSDSTLQTNTGVGLWFFQDATHPSCVVGKLTKA